MIGAIADDFTGGTDVAVALRRAGLRTALYFRTPDDGYRAAGRDAVVVALKSRTVDPDDAVAASLAATRWLQVQGATQIYFKYCSTFDSTPRGNIGPVADALRAYLGAELAVVVPSSPEHLRTQYLGHLFVDDVPLADSHMRHHPLTPMTKSRVVELLADQTDAKVDLVPHPLVRAGRRAISRAVDQLSGDGVTYLVVDAIDDEDLDEIGRACIDHRLVTGAAGLAGGLGRAWADRLGTSAAARGDARGATPDGPAAVLAGSCSARTLEQVDRMRHHRPSYRLDVLAHPDAERLGELALAWIDRLTDDGAPLVYSSSTPAELRDVHDRLGVDESARILEDAMGRIARGLVDRGVRRLIVAGGETSGSVVTALDVRGGLIGAEAAPGVPWIHLSDGDPAAGVALLLKSGNFGDRDLLLDASADPAVTADPTDRPHSDKAIA